MRLRKESPPWPMTRRRSSTSRRSTQGSAKTRTPSLERLRAAHPVMRDEMAGSWFISRYEDVRRILTDLTLWRDPHRAESAAVLTRRIVEQSGERQNGDGGMSILLMDDPDHARIRNPLAQALYKRVAKSRARRGEDRRRRP